MVFSAKPREADVLGGWEFRFSWLNLCFCLCWLLCLSVGTHNVYAQTSRPVLKTVPRPVGSLAGNSAKAETELTFLFTSDLFGQLRDFRCTRPGMTTAALVPPETDLANMLALVERERKQAVATKKPPPLLLSTGNNLSPGMSSRFLLGLGDEQGTRLLVGMLRRFQYDVMGLGTQDFWVSPEQLEKFWRLSHAAGLVHLASNVSIKNKKHAIARYVNRDGKDESSYFVFKRGGFTIGVIHLLPEEFEKQVSKESVQGISFSDPKETAKELIATMRKDDKVDFVIALSQLETSSTRGKNVTSLVSQKNPGIDLIITNELRAEGRPLAITVEDPQRGGIPIVGGHMGASHLGRIRLTMHRGADGKAQWRRVRMDWIPLQKSVFHPALRKDFTDWETLYCKDWGQPLGQGRISDPKGMSQRNFLLTLLQLMRIQTRAEIAFLPPHILNSSPFPLRGYVTQDDLFRAIPSDESLETIELPGSVIQSLVEKYWDADNSDSLKALTFLGIEKHEDDILINRRILEKKSMYRVVTLRYVSSTTSGWFEKVPTTRALATWPNGRTIQLRHLALEFFQFNKLRSFAVATKQAQSGPSLLRNMTKTFEIPTDPQFFNLADRPLWRFWAEVNLNFTSIFVNPINISGFYTQKDAFNSNFYQKFQMVGNINLKAQVDTRMHLWIIQANLEYDADTSHQWGDIGPTLPPIFQENTDRLTFKTEYHLRYFSARSEGKRRWYHTSPFVEAVLETELTRGVRPDLKETEYLETFPEIFRHFETRAKVGLSFKIVEQLVVKLGFAWRKEWALDLVVKPGNAPAVNTDHNIGLSVDYELSSIKLFSLGNRPVTWVSSASYLLTFLVSSRPQQLPLDIHDLTWENKLSFVLVGHLQLSLGFRMFLYRGTIRRNPTSWTDPLEHGPWAFRMAPYVSLGFNWDVRSQTYGSP